MSARSRRRASVARPPLPVRRSPQPAAFAILLLVAGLFAYTTSFNGIFVGDDTDAIVNNPNITSLSPLSRALDAPRDTTVAGRPVVSLSLAINYALAAPGGLDPWGYHLVNLLVHLAAGLALFGVVRRTLVSPPLVERFGAPSAAISFAVALLWLLHPLQTSSVTYVVQRAESLMGLFLLSTLYAAIRATEPQAVRPIGWTVIAVTACALGMASKEVMVVAPVLVGLWFWTFRPAVLNERHTTLLLTGLAATWLLLAWLVASQARSESVGFGLGGWTWWSYLRTQAGVIVHYLRLALFPSPLVFMYDWPPASLGDVWPQFALLVLLAAATLVALLRRHPLGFAGAWFLLILAPSSSVLPIATEQYSCERLERPRGCLSHSSR
jgi:hypothetical protein